MTSLANEANHGIQHFLKEQSAIPGKATLSLYEFDNTIDHVHDFTPLDVDYKLVPRNMTALLDACGKAITETGERLAAMREDQRPGKVTVLITTDGLENASQEWTAKQVRELINRQRDVYKWQFAYVGADEKAFDEAASIGIPKMSTLHYAHTNSGTRSAYASASSASTTYNVGASDYVEFTDEDRDAAEDKADDE
jgi:hypothetical protein